MHKDYVPLSWKTVIEVCGHGGLGKRVAEGIYSTRRQMLETSSEENPYQMEAPDGFSETAMVLDAALDRAEADAPPSTVKGIQALRLKAQG